MLKLRNVDVETKRYSVKYVQESGSLEQEHIKNCSWLVIFTTSVKRQNILQNHKQQPE